MHAVATLPVPHRGHTHTHMHRRGEPIPPIFATLLPHVWHHAQHVRSEHPWCKCGGGGVKQRRSPSPSPIVDPVIGLDANGSGHSLQFGHSQCDAYSMPLRVQLWVLSTHNFIFFKHTCNHAHRHKKVFAWKN